MLRLAVFCLLPIGLFAQDASLSMAGSVVNARTGEPVARAVVSVLGSAEVSPGSTLRVVNRSAVTDASGAFQIPSLPAAKYSVTAQKPGMAWVRVQSPAVIDLKSSVEGLRISLSELGSITGKVVDDNGEPMRGVNIELIVSPVQDGLRETRTLRPVRTDDRGVYRFADLSPGKNYLKATGQGGGNLGSGSV